MCNQNGCQTPHLTGAKYRIWVYGHHWDHRTRSAAEKRIARMSHYEREAAELVRVAHA